MADILKDMATRHSQRVAQQSGQNGVVLTELALTLPLLVLLLVGIYDLSLVLRENVLLTEAIRSGLRSVVVSAPFERNRYTGSSADREKAYAEERYERSIEVAKYLLQRNGLDDSHYYYNMFEVLRTDVASGRTYPSVQMNISRKETATRFLLAPDNLYLSCVGGSTLVPGVFIGPGFAVFEPSLNTNCSP